MPAYAAQTDRTQKEAAVATKAVIRAADNLGINNKVLGKIIGYSEATISRMRRGEYTVKRGDKEFELAVLFARMYRSLDAISGGDANVASNWMINENLALRSIPIEAVQKIQGLTDVIRYLDSRRAII